MKGKEIKVPYPYCPHADCRYRSRFFDQVGHQTIYAFIRNRHFFTISCHLRYLSALGFLKYRVWIIEFDELDFLSISNSNFTGYTGSKNLVQTRQKFQFIKLDFSNLIFQDPSADRYRVSQTYQNYEQSRQKLGTFLENKVL